MSTNFYTIDSNNSNVVICEKDFLYQSKRKGSAAHAEITLFRTQGFTIKDGTKYNTSIVANIIRINSGFTNSLKTC